MYKTILVHVDETARSRQRIEVAARLATQYEAHLVGAAMTGLSAYAFPVGAIEAGMAPIMFPIEELRAAANRALDVFETAASGVGVNAFERRLVNDDAGLGITLQARYSDLVVISQSSPDEFLPRLRSDFPEYVLLNCARPVLVLPHAGVEAVLGAIVTVAWNGSAEAVRAITTAIPVLSGLIRSIWLCSTLTHKQICTATIPALIWRCTLRVTGSKLRSQQPRQQGRPGNPCCRSQSTRVPT
jgi:nucleotide-binding universal stress UspA family protein